MTTDRDKKWEEIEKQAEYGKSLMLAMLARASHEDTSTIRTREGADYHAIFEGQKPATNFSLPYNYTLATDEADRSARYSSGLKAFSFENRSTQTLIIAFPGMDWSARQITGPARAMAVDGDIVGLLRLLPVGERSETSVRQTGKVQQFIYGSHRLDP
ncbi:MAG: hypothetical protein LBL59_10790 [Xanthomonadaceae bacterium]|jgi:hypothetical protein|nr:hypothetical protein [Xanthomonadaceae bacterium]